MRCTVIIAALLLTGGAAQAAPRPLDCARAPEPAFCRQAQEQFRQESAKPNDYQTMGNVAYCLGTGCDAAFVVNHRDSCRLRREILQRHTSRTDSSDESHLTHCASAGL
ncbi:MAG: hypothetical protein B7Z40_12105 [Bosea sp. 12-68-7]|nr:MAG: hypothetical protein B7Z40_12105 [Bosea sp. 12-68-7]OYX02355.1 MAG: hypothetical protein B7Z14_03665 [Bosea sp. 32-68-6]